VGDWEARGKREMKELGIGGDWGWDSYLYVCDPTTPPDMGLFMAGLSFIWAL